MMDDRLIVAIAFILSIVAARIAVKIVWGFGIDTLKKRSFAGMPIHHFSYGLLLVIVSGYISMVAAVDHWVVPCLFGVGLGLVVDELYPVHLTLGNFWEKTDKEGELYWSKIAYITIGVVVSILVGVALIY